MPKKKLRLINLLRKLQSKGYNCIPFFSKPDLMDRRATLSALFGALRSPDRTETLTRVSATMPVVTLTSGLEPYGGAWGEEQAAHLLRRTTFGPSYVDVKLAADQGLSATIEQLFQELPVPDPPVNYDNSNDPYVPIGETWIDAIYSTTVNLQGPRSRSLRAWTMGQLINEGISIREKLTLFWHNHFAISNVNDPKFVYRHSALLRSFAWGNFKDLIKAVTIDPAMLRFLNGNQNTNAAPNENYARELLELFTIGKGPLVGPGDYTNYTEDDVIQIARVLTGWRDQGYNTLNTTVSVGATFRPNQHDTGVKQLSARFDNVQISNMGDQEYAYLIDIIFQKSEVARFISRKLYRWFVYYVIDDNAEANVIEPMAQMLIDNDFEIKPVLQTLLGSAHFFDILNVGPMIKNPIDFSVFPLRQLAVAFPNDNQLLQKYTLWLRIFNAISPMDMVYYDPPNVAGWKAYYQEPQYYRTWINASTLQARMGYTNSLTGNGVGTGQLRAKVDPLLAVTLLDDPYDPNAVIDGFVKILFPQPITASQHDALKEVLLPGLPDYEWTVEYSAYEANPDDTNLADAVSVKLRNLLQVMLSMPEFYLS